MENKNNSRKIIAEIEVRVGLRVYKMEINSQFRWAWILGIILMKWIYNFFENPG
ncbi:MAG: hypothetical protein K2Q26_09120 [Bdellovibrionales bacterium]|nr:hypothetical protein [Bdellovibrionales bacterium]